MRLKQLIQELNLMLGSVTVRKAASHYLAKKDAMQRKLRKAGILFDSSASMETLQGLLQKLESFDKEIKQ